MTGEEQIIQLLREIRDLQKSHFEKYQEYTEKLSEFGRRQEQEAQRREQASQAELHKLTREATRGIWIILAICLLLLFFLRPVGDWIMKLFGK